MLDKRLFERYKGLIFDMDGTVIDTMPSHKKAWDMVGEQMGYPLDGQIMYQLGGAPVRTIAQAMMNAANMPAELIDKVISLKREYGVKLIMQHSSLLPAAEVVKTFVGKKPLALGTGSHRKITEILLDKFQLHRCFSAVVTAEDVQKHKPAPDTFLRCAELIAVKPADCLVFEDADLGVQAGLAAGMDVFDVRIGRIVEG
ncbi:beta-phosphoglucomutase family hydrolase [Necropsobacter massiliensis]|uniref:beta-phosphoglucomutase family hydrolase n=1 Tax=Necropsobacter massiliensis TaxID=1400001 RepID=UPI0005961ED2|nr:beta-phosphoglucomutase family hydrolase [Necropsobacter massiliensis]